MHKSLIKKLAISAVMTTLTLVCHAADYQEVGYDDLVRQISSKKRTLEKSTIGNPLDDVKIHTGIGYVNSFNEMRINDKNLQRYSNGIQLAVGIDLFSENWFGETSFRNFGMTNNGSEEMFLKEFDLKLGYKAEIKKPLWFRLQGGLANRYLTINDSMKDLYVDEVTPMFMGSAGLISQLNSTLSFGLDFSARSALVNNTVDKSSFDFAFTVGASL